MTKKKRRLFEVLSGPLQCATNAQGRHCHHCGPCGMHIVGIEWVSGGSAVVGKPRGVVGGPIAIPDVGEVVALFTWIPPDMVDLFILPTGIVQLQLRTLEAMATLMWDYYDNEGSALFECERCRRIVKSGLFGEDVQCCYQCHVSFADGDDGGEGANLSRDRLTWFKMVHFRMAANDLRSGTVQGANEAFDNLREELMLLVIPNALLPSRHGFNLKKVSEVTGLPKVTWLHPQGHASTVEHSDPALAIIDQAPAVHSDPALAIDPAWAMMMVSRGPAPGLELGHRSWAVNVSLRYTMVTTVGARCLSRRAISQAATPRSGVYTIGDRGHRLAGSDDATGGGDTCIRTLRQEVDVEDDIYSTTSFFTIQDLAALKAVDRRLDDEVAVLVILMVPQIAELWRAPEQSKLWWAPEQSTNETEDGPESPKYLVEQSLGRTGDVTCPLRCLSLARFGAYGQPWKRGGVWAKQRGAA